MTHALRFPRGLYGITPEWDDTDRLLRALEQAAKGGMVALQWRRKTAGANQALEQARQVSQRCHELGVLCIINDDWRLANMVGADGVHLGRDDGSLVQARQALGPAKIIGTSCYNDIDLGRRALDLDVDYIAFGAVYPSSIKPDAVRVDLPTLGQANTLTIQAAQAGQRAAVVAIGGITPQNLQPVIQAGADSAALISGLFNAHDVYSAASHCQSLFE